MIFRSHRSSVLRLALGCTSVLFACDKPTSQTETTNAVAPQNQVPALPASVVEPAMVAATVVEPSAWMTRLDPDMKDVIDQLTSLNGKPIETLSAADARKQPGPTDAVKALMKKQDKSTTARKGRKPNQQNLNP